MRVNFRHLEEDPKGHDEHGEHPAPKGGAPSRDGQLHKT